MILRHKSRSRRIPILRLSSAAEDIVTNDRTIGCLGPPIVGPRSCRSVTDNWSGPKWLSVYFSKRDSRTLVPKQIRAMGGTLNLGKTAGVFCLIGVVVGLLLLIVMLGILALMGA